MTKLFIVNILSILYYSFLCNLIVMFGFVPIFAVEYEKLCPGGQGFRPNDVTAILEGIFNQSHFHNFFI